LIICEQQSDGFGGSGYINEERDRQPDEFRETT
jgi:hypothetical protein